MFGLLDVVNFGYRAMKLDRDQAQVLLEEYQGPRYEIEKQMMVFFGFLLAIPLRISAHANGMQIYSIDSGWNCVDGEKMGCWR